MLPSDPSEKAVLAPSLAWLELDEKANIMLLHGIFGKTQGKVLVNGHEQGITKWDDDRIECDLPAADGPDSAGNVEVEVGGHKSNAVQLTEWRVTLKYKEVRNVPPEPDSAGIITKTVDCSSFSRTGSRRSAPGVI